MSKEKRRKVYSIARLRAGVLRFYKKHGRHDLPWRKTHDPYKIVVSEIMLQQTHVARVIQKYKAFLKSFPTIQKLAAAPLAQVLVAWNGLGYNRRAKFLHQMSQEVVEKWKGKFPERITDLESLPGIGPYTARAIAAFAYNHPSVFIETNIRTVFIHHFFPNKKTISDAMLMPLIEAGVDKKNPRMWYAALMDYGTYLKGQGSRAHRKSSHYTKQSTFTGSRRQLRGAIIHSLLEAPRTTRALATTTEKKISDINSVLRDLILEKMIEKQGRKYTLAGNG